MRRSSPRSVSDAPPQQSCQSGPELYCADFSQDLRNCGACFKIAP